MKAQSPERLHVLDWVGLLLDASQCTQESPEQKVENLKFGTGSAGAADRSSNGLGADNLNAASNVEKAAESQHVNVEEALKIHADLGARRSLGVHWGTFELTDEALDEPPRQLERQRADLGLTQDEFFTLAIGGTRRLTRRTP